MKIYVPALLALLSIAPTAALSAPAPLTEAPPQLNLAGFAYCLSKEAPQVDLLLEREIYGFSSVDLFLLYLSVYPGRRIPGLGLLLQDPAHLRWARAFEPQEAKLAQELRDLIGAPEASLTPNRFFRMALDACGGRIFCASLTSHNVLRTLGRHAQAIYRDPRTGALRDINPEWFNQDREVWLIQIPFLQRLLMPLRADGSGDRWGEWYHFHGILGFVFHEMALRTEMRNVEVIVRLNEVLNPLLAGGIEEPEKARMDLDSIRVAWYFIRGEAAMKRSPASDKFSTPGYCDLRKSYIESHD